MKRDTEKDLVPPDYAVPEEPAHRSSAYATDPGIRMPTANRELLSGVVVAQQRRKERERLGREIAARGGGGPAAAPIASLVPVERPVQQRRELEQGDAPVAERGPTPTARFRQRATISWLLIALVPVVLLVLAVAWSAAKRVWSATPATTSAAAVTAPLPLPTSSGAMVPHGIESMIPPPEPVPSPSHSAAPTAPASATASAPRVAPATASTRGSAPPHPSASTAPAPVSSNPSLKLVNE
ncbi:MAG: hypothetical protein HOO96_06170 [Polyangiaceae bacterium]|nr:hypothetical protein [Polyangiaceae bacterium]